MAGAQYSFKSLERKVHPGPGDVGQLQRDTMLREVGELSKPCQTTITADGGCPRPSKKGFVCVVPIFIIMVVPSDATKKGAQ